MSKEFGAKSKSSIAILLYSIDGEGFISRALSNIFPERSMPKAKVAPRSMAYRQCQPKPHPKSNTRFPLNQATSSLAHAILLLLSALVQSETSDCIDRKAFIIILISFILYIVGISWPKILIFVDTDMISFAIF